MEVASTRSTAAARRDDVLDAALIEFADRGFEGASTEEIARRAGISQPYLFRLFGTKKELYLEVVRRCLRDTLTLFQDASAGHHGEEALDAIGKAYVELLRNRTRLRLQMQAYADCDDPEVRAVVREGYGALVEHAEGLTGGDTERVRDFFAFGMLLNVFASMDLLNQDEAWAKRLLEACLPPQ
jgi:AcrR family transcriptional regulator